MRGRDRAVLGLPRTPRGPGRVLRSRRVRAAALHRRLAVPARAAPIVYRPVGALSQATLPRLEPALFAEVAAILAAHPGDKGLIHVASYGAGRRLVQDLADPGAARGATAAVDRLQRRQGPRARAPPGLAAADGARFALAAGGRRSPRRLPAFPDPHQAALPRPRRSVDGGAPVARSRAGTRPRPPRPCCRRTAARVVTPTTTA